jgi:outer membrane lipoprotein-sorting protein
MDNSKRNIHYSNGSVNKSTKEMLLLLVPILAILILAVSLTSANTVSAQSNSTSQQQQASSSNTSDKSGTIKSVQTDAQGKWNLDGTWSLKGANSGSPTFTAEFSMAKLDGSAKHTHNISDFKIAGTQATDSSGTTYSGTATVSLKAGPATNVPVTILISNNGNFSINIDPKATENHFGNTPIMGKVNTV